MQEPVFLGHLDPPCSCSCSEKLLQLFLLPDLCSASLLLSSWSVSHLCKGMVAPCSCNLLMHVSPSGRCHVGQHLHGYAVSVALGSRAWHCPAVKFLHRSKSLAPDNQGSDLVGCLSLRRRQVNSWLAKNKARSLQWQVECTPVAGELSNQLLE